MLVSGGRGGGDAQFAEMEGELVGDGVGVGEGDIEGVTEGVKDAELVNDGVGVGVGVGDEENDIVGVDDAVSEYLIKLALADALADADALEVAVADADAVEVAVADADAEDVRVGVGTNGGQQNLNSVSIELVMNAHPYDTDATAQPIPFIPVLRGSSAFSHSG